MDGRKTRCIAQSLHKQGNHVEVPTA
jgi:hypothetical protein